MGKVTYRNFLSKVQRCASIGISGVRRSTPQAALDIILHLIPIKEFVRGMAIRGLFRLKELGLLDTSKAGHVSILDEDQFNGRTLSLAEPTD